MWFKLWVPSRNVLLFLHQIAKLIFHQNAYIITAGKMMAIIEEAYLTNTSTKGMFKTADAVRLYVVPFVLRPKQAGSGLIFSGIPFSVL